MPIKLPLPFSSSTVITHLLIPFAALYLLYPRMTSLLRALVAGPRIRHEESSLDLCYVSKTAPIIIAMSVPADSFPRKAYRNPVESVLEFLDKTHGTENWMIWEFRAEGAGYPDSVFRDRIQHAPFPDHHPPPFALVPGVMASMRNWLMGGEDKVAVVHCKAGKGRSGTMSSAYLISEHNFTAEAAMAQFTAARMRPGFGDGVSIPSQRRYLRYVESWVRDHNKHYVERSIRINEIHVYGLRSGVRVAVQGYEDAGKVIKTFHTFKLKEKTIVTTYDSSRSSSPAPPLSTTATSESDSSASSTPRRSKTLPNSDALEDHHDGVADVIFRPQAPLIVPANDVNIDFERRTKPKYGLALVTSIGHAWFNAFFEAAQKGDDSGVFEITWSEMDGIKGTYKKGLQTLDRLKVVWSVVHEGEKEIREPAEGEEVVLPSPAKNKKMQEEERGVGSIVVEDTDESGPESQSPARAGEGAKGSEARSETSKESDESGAESKMPVVTHEAAKKSEVNGESSTKPDEAGAGTQAPLAGNEAPKESEVKSEPLKEPDAERPSGSQ